MSMQLVKHIFRTGYVAHRFVQPMSAITISKLHSTVAPTSEATTSSSTDEPITMENPFEKEKQKCILCRMNIDPNYKNVRLLSQFQSSYTGRIYGRHITGLCKMQQERVEAEIIKSTVSGYMPAYHKAVEFLQDPKLFDPERPIRPHNY